MTRRPHPSWAVLVLPWTLAACFDSFGGGQEGEEVTQDDRATESGGDGGYDGADGTGGDGGGGSGADGGGDGGGSDDGLDAGDEDPTGDPEDTGIDVELDCTADAGPTLFLSPDDSNSTASPVLARLAVLDGAFPLSAVPIRTWEFMNHYTFDYPAAEPGEIALYASLVEAPEAGENSWALQVGVASEARTAEGRAPVNLTFAVDTSGSMEGAPLDRVNDGGQAIASALKEGDRVSLVTWSSSASVVLDSHMVTRPNDPVVLAAFAGLTTGGGTDLSNGLSVGFELAAAAADADRIDRLVVVTDGGANLGETDASIIAENVRDGHADGIYVAGMGVGGSGTYNPALMDEITDAGNGASFFLGTSADAWSTLSGDGFLRTFDVAARDLRLELELPVGFEIVRFSGEEVSTDPSEVDPQHLAPNDSMVFLQTLHTDCPDELDEDTPIGIKVTWTAPISGTAQTSRLDTTLGELLRGDPGLLRKGQAVQDTADALAAWRSTELATEDKEAAREQATRSIDTALSLDPDDLDLAELQAMMRAL